jgi:hypothetical protein
MRRKSSSKIKLPLVILCVTAGLGLVALCLRIMGTIFGFLVAMVVLCWLPCIGYGLYYGKRFKELPRWLHVSFALGSVGLGLWIALLLVVFVAFRNFS